MAETAPGASTISDRPLVGALQEENQSLTATSSSERDAPATTRSTARAATFRKFRELLMLKRFEGRDNTPTEVVTGIFIGSLGAASNMETLQAAGITHILCVAANLPLQFSDQFVYERLSLADSPTAPLHEVIPDGITFIDRAIAAGGRVLVHCFVGRSRSASIILAYLLCRHAMTLDDAMKLLKSVRPQVQPNSGFLKYLQSLESRLTSDPGHL